MNKGHVNSNITQLYNFNPKTFEIKPKTANWPW